MTDDDRPLDDDAVFAYIHPSIRRFAAVVRPKEEDVDDLIQDALVQTLARSSLSELDDPEAYLRMAIVRIASNHRRRLGRKRRAQVRAAAGLDTSSESEYPSALHDLMRLDPIDRAVLYLSVVEGRSYRDVGALVGCSEQAARARSSRALRKLRKALEEEVRDG